MRELVFDVEAEEEITAAVTWYEEQEPGLGAAFVAELDELLDGLSRRELRGVGVPGVRHDLSVRRLLMRRFPYALVCMELPAEVHVIALAHHKRRPGYWRHRE